MFFCCNKSSAKADSADTRELPSDTDAEKRLSAATLQNVAPSAVADSHNTNTNDVRPPIEASPPPPPTETMDYARARREAEERELDRVRSEISGLSMVREERESGALRLSMGAIGSAEKEKGFLGLPMSPGLSSPRLSEQKEAQDEDDWARVVMESVSRAGSTYEGDKSRPVTPEVRIEPPEQDVPDSVPSSPIREKAVEEPKEVVNEQEVKEEKKEEIVMKEVEVRDDASIYITSEAAAAFINYNFETLPPVPSIHEQEPEQEEENVVEPERAQTPKPPMTPVQDEHTSLYITPDAAASFMNYDASLAPPTPAASFSGEGNDAPKRISAPVRCPSPAPSFAISDYESDIRNSKRASTLSTISTIAQAAASAAIERHSIAGNRMSSLSTYSTASFYSTRPSSPAPPTNNRLSLLRCASPTPSRPDTAKTNSSKKSNAHLLPYLSPLTAQLLPRLDKLLSTTSILSAYSRWETAMSLRREVRAFVASGVDDFLDEDGEIENDAGLRKAVDAFLARGQRVQDAAVNDGDDSMNDPRMSGKGFGDVRAFWAGDNDARNSLTAV